MIRATVATHICQKCGTLWRQLDDGSFTLRSPTCQPCCDNAMPHAMPLAQAYTDIKGALHDEIAANFAFRDAGGALPDEDMPTFCARILKERDDALRSLRRKPTQSECVDIAEWHKSECAACFINPSESEDYGRAMVDAVRLVMLAK